ncbi:MAG: YraN family protein [Holosporales bacterium]|jgi:putative endonuclease|nr:YraN family protein [Holosporales bacterium]
MTMTAYQRGLVAEDRAARFLETQGYRILHKRLKTSVGEIDLVAEKAEDIVFVEVKFRQRMIDALETLSVRQRQRILTAAELFLAETPLLAHRPLRFDVIALTPAQLQHVENAFWKEG